MRRNILRNPVLLMSVMFLLSGCENAGYKELTHKVFFAEAANSSSKSVTMEEDGAKANITLRLDKPIDGDVSVKLGIDPTLIDQYNSINQTELKLLPKEYIEDFDFNKLIVIPANKVTADPTVIGIKPFLSNERYALPLKITEVHGSASATNRSSGYLLLIDKPLIVSCPTLSASGTLASDMVVCGPFKSDNKTPTNDWGIVTSEWSLEFWVKMDGFFQNQALFNSGSTDGGSNNEIYIRFGDAGAPFNWLQIKTMGTQADTAKDFIRNKWYHIALVYDGGQVVIYVNGDIKAAKATKGGTIKIDQMEMISSGSTWFKANCNMSEIRFWKKALSVTQIRNNRFYEVNPENPDLIAYWKMNEGSGINFKDCTKNGHDAIATGAILKGWLHDQRFDR